MKEKFYIALFLLLLSVDATVKAQAVSPMVWAFGYSAGLDFRNGKVDSFVSGITAAEACATQCDAGGNLLFYTDGRRVWNRNHKLVPHSDTHFVLDNTSSMQGVHIVPVPGDTTRYYVFRQTPLEVVAPSGGMGYLEYSIVNMDLDNGLGDIVSTQKDIRIDSFLAEKMAVIKNKDCSFWLLVHAMDTTAFKSYKITHAGITGPVVSYSCSYISDPVFADFGSGEMTYSSKRNKLFTSTTRSSGYHMYVEIHDFDISTGVVSNAQMLSDTNLNIYLCLSPNQDLLYASGPLFIGGAMHGSIFQYDLSLPTAQDIRNSRDRVFYDPGVDIQDIALGPDNKIYVSSYTSHNHISRIEYPDVKGAGCTFSHNVIQLHPFTSATSGLPSPMHLPWAIKRNTAIDTTVCYADELLLSAPQGFDKYRWSTADTSSSVVIKNNGNYWVKSVNNCAEQSDTFKVSISNVLFSIGNDTSICEQVKLHVPLNNVSYLWNNGSTLQEITAYKSGNYVAEVVKGNCKYADTITITNNRLGLDLGSDTVLCHSTSWNIELPGNTTYLWNDGSTAANYQVTQPGTYVVKATNGTCTASDSVSVSYGTCNCTTWVPTAFTPNGDGNNDYFGPVLNAQCPVKNYKLEVYNRWGQRVFSSTDVKGRWNGYNNGNKLLADIGTYMYQLELTDIYDKKTYQKGDVTLIR